jgi:hypothetical protein
MATKKILIKKLPGFSTVWHEESQLVFKSAKELVVIGKLVDKEIVALTEDDIQVCDKHKFKYEIDDTEEEEGEGLASGEEAQETTEEGAEEEEEVEEPSGEETVTVQEKKEEEVKVPVVEEKNIEEVTVATADDFTNAVGRITTIWTVTNSQYKCQIHDLENDLEKTRKELATLQEMYDKMKVKFDGIRQLFSV